MAPPPPPLPDARASSLTLALLASGCGGRVDAGVVSNADGNNAPDVAGEQTSSNGGSSGSSQGTTDPSVVGAPPRTSVAGATTGTGTDPVLDLTAPERCEPNSTAAQVAREKLRAFAVQQSEFARRTIYSWTVAEQVEELKADPTLLTRSMTSDGERGRAADVLLAMSNTDAVAAVLSRPEYEKKRFGWSNAWATLLGWDTEDYGDRLIQITLREEAWIARAVIDWSERITWAFADVSGNPVTREQVLADPERLGAVYFEDRRGGGCGTLSFDGAAFREYFLHNEAMIESWSIYTDDIRDHLDQARDAIGALLDAGIDGGCPDTFYCWPDVALNVWEGVLGEVDLLYLYSLGLAFPNDAYRPTLENWQALSDALARVPFEEPLAHDYGPSN